MHPTLDLTYWNSLLLPDLKKEPHHIEGRLLSGTPHSVVIMEHYRQLAAAAGCLVGESRPVDRFVFGEGEPPERHLTKVNGLPYRPRTKPWPTDGEGRQLTFVCQFCFADSRDHLSDLPGDVLLVFMKTRRSVFTQGNVPAPPIYEDSLLFEWYPLGLEDLVQDPPTPLLDFPKCYAIRHRSLDYYDDETFTEFLLSPLPEAALPTHEFWRTGMLRGFTSWPQMKIGGIPFHYKRPDLLERPRFLGGFESVVAVLIPEFPACNELKSDALDEGISDESSFEIDHLLSLNFFLSDSGSADWMPEFT